MSARFDGVDDGINLGSGLSIGNGWAAMTFCAWVQRFGTTGLNQEFIFFEVNPNTANPRAEFEYDVAMNKLATYATAPDAGAFQFGLSAAAVLPIDVGVPGTWVHCACVVNVATNRIDWYVNGVLSVSTVVVFGAAAFSATNTGTDNVIACQRNVGANFEFFQGTLSDLRIYNAALSADEIQCIAAMRGHDGVRPSRRAMQLQYIFIGNGGLALSTVNVVDSSGGQAVPNPVAIFSVPVINDDTIALRRRYS